MKKKKRYFRILILLIFFVEFVQQGYSQVSADSIIMSAMRDELYRNYKNLASDNEVKPFFISYTIANARITIVSASLGAIINSNQQNYKDWQVRVMAGDYNLNDENFSYNQPEEAVFQGSIPMPVDNDYEGIRRSLWLTTNNVYRSAAQTYKNKIALIEHKQLDESALEIPDFSHAPTVKMVITEASANTDLALFERRARNLSSIFCDYNTIYSSAVTFSLFESTVFFINSEGTEVQFPCNIITVTIQAGTMSDDSEKLTRNIVYTVGQSEELPSDEVIKSDIIKLVDNLLTMRNAECFDDEYTGPVLIIGEAAAESMEQLFFAGSDALIAYRETLESSNQMNMYYEYNDNRLQSKINKQVVSKDITVTAIPFQSEYNGIPLIGSFKIDAEGVVPPEKLVLIENGVIKTLLNGRTPSRYVPESNGHTRFNYNYRGLSSQTGPGVIMINSSITYSIDDLKEELIRQAKDQGLDYAIIIRTLNVNGSEKPYNYYKVSVKDGTEKLIRSARLKSFNLLALKRSPRFSDSLLVHNTLIDTNNDEGRGLSGIPSSFILPKAILLEEVELESFRKPLTSMLPIVNNPVGNKEEDQKAISKDNN